MSRYARILDELSRRRRAIISWTRARLLAWQLVPDLDKRMRERMHGGDLGEADVKREWQKHKSTLSDADLLAKNPAAEVKRFEAWRTGFFRSLKMHECAAQCQRSVNDEADITFCVYYGHLHVCTHEHCELLKDTSDNVSCTHTSKTTIVYESEFDADPIGDMRRLGKGSMRLNSDTVRRKKSEKLRVQEQMLLQLEFEKLLCAVESMHSKEDVPTKRARVCVETPPTSPRFSFLQSPRTRESYVVPKAAPPQWQISVVERRSLFDRLTERWFEYPGRADAVMPSFVFVAVADMLGLTEREFHTDEQRRVWLWLHPPRVAVLTQAPPLTAHETRVATLMRSCRFDSQRVAAGDGIDI